MDETSGAIAKVEYDLTEFDRVSAGIEALKTKYHGVVFAVQTTKGMDEACAARAEIREPRYAVQRTAKAAKDQLNAIKRNIDERSEQITEALLAIESPIDQQIKAEEARKKEEKAKREAAELARISAHRDGLAAIAAAPAKLLRKSSVEIQLEIDKLQAMEIGESWEEFAAHAAAARTEAIDQMLSMLDQAKADERQREEMAKAAAALAAERAEMERQKAEAERLLAEAKAAAERELAAARAELERQRASEKAEAERQRAADKAASELLRAEAERQRAEIEQQRAEIARQQSELQKAPKEEPVAVLPVSAAEVTALLAPQKVERPTDREIILAVAERFGVDEAQAFEWILQITPEFA